MSCSRSAKREIDVLGPRASRALREASRGGLLGGLPQRDRDYLLGLHLRAYEKVLGGAQLEDRPDLLPVLIELASIAQELGSAGASLSVLERLRRSRQSRPRALATMPDDEALHAPECGVGSPHRLAVTIYHDPVTGPLMSAVLTPSGAGHPSPDTPTLGMSAGEALSLISDSLDRFQASSGLARVMRWETHDADRLEEQIRTALESAGEGTKVLRSEPRHTEGSSVIHVMPLLHRSPQGEAVAAEIEIPYRMLGPKRVFDLLREGRSTYMKQLIIAAQRRREFARDAWDKQDKAVKDWQRKSDAQKQEICRRRPTVTITMAYDWNLGVQVYLDAPEEVPVAVYEEQHRPQIRDHAKQMEEQFAALCKKLQEMNRPGGKADVLTFKLLVDSMIRRAPLWIPDGGFRKEYQAWLDAGSAPTWEVVKRWAREHHVPVESLARDNVCFNAMVDAKTNVVRIVPMVLVDLHDFLVRIDGAAGVMEVFPAGKTPSLAQLFQPVAAQKVTDPGEKAGHVRRV